MNRRGFIRTALCGAGAIIGATMAGTVDAEGPTPAVAALPGTVKASLHRAFIGGHRPAGSLTPATEGEAVHALAAPRFVTGPDPSTSVNVAFRTDGTVIVLPPGAPLLSPETVNRWMGVERAVFPESDPRHGAVTIYDPASDLLPPAEWTVPLIRAHYLYALGQRTPNVPIDGNHLAVRFMPRDLYPVLPRIDGEDAKHVTESYSGPHGWLVQMVADERGPILFGDSLRYRIRAGNVALWVDGAGVNPGDYTASLLP